MTIALEVLFAMLVAADTILTYIVIGSGKGTEIGPVAKYYIDNKPVAIIITVVATAFLIGWLRLAWLCRKHWRILHGR